MAQLKRSVTVGLFAALVTAMAFFSLKGNESVSVTASPSPSPVMQWNVGVRLQKVADTLVRYKGSKDLVPNKKSNSRWLIMKTSDGFLCEQETENGLGISSTIALFDGTREMQPLGMRHSETGVVIRIAGDVFTAHKSSDMTPLSPANSGDRFVVNQTIIQAHECLQEKLNLR
ncbi:MAG: hypothetical protein EAY65_02025 [Alphaproteobacteria bacterium]|nr:MAG: hypothetical protein EAY65_02025 [Alphaproteobacteria bacterium]